MAKFEINDDALLQLAANAEMNTLLLKTLHTYVFSMTSSPSALATENLANMIATIDHMNLGPDGHDELVVEMKRQLTNFSDDVIARLEEIEENRRSK